MLLLNHLRLVIEQLAATEGRPPIPCESGAFSIRSSAVALRARAKRAYPCVCASVPWNPVRGITRPEGARHLKPRTRADELMERSDVEMVLPLPVLQTPVAVHTAEEVQW